MGKYQKIVSLIENSVPEYTDLKVVTRGTPIMPDPLMRGQLRFAKKTGANFAVMNPDNQFTLTEAGQIDQSLMTVDTISAWLEPDALLTFNRTEMMEVDTWNPTTKTIFIKAPLSANRSVGTILDLWAVPLVVHFQADAGDTQIVVRSRYQLVNGDAVTFPTGDEISSLKQIDVDTVNFAGLDMDPTYPNIFVLHLAEPLPQTIRTTDRFYLRAFPAYTSNVVTVPTRGSSQMCPFLLDFVGSPLNSIPSYDETFSVRTFDSSASPVTGGFNSYQKVDHNFPVANRPIFAENMIFWDIIRGAGGFVGPARYRLITSEEMMETDDGPLSVGRVGTKIVPGLPSGVAYRFRVRANTAGRLRVLSNHGVLIDQTIPFETEVPIVVQASGDPLERIDIVYTSPNAKSELLISDSTLPTNPVVESFQYTYCFRVLGTTNFQATSIIVKPYFLGLSDLSMRYNTQKNYNSGFIYL